MMDSKETHNEEVDSEDINPIDSVEIEQEVSQEIGKLENRTSHYDSAPKLKNLHMEDS